MNKIEENIKQINKFRLENKNQWIGFKFLNDEGQILTLKCYNTWTQRGEVEFRGRIIQKLYGAMNLKPNEWKCELKTILEDFYKGVKE